MQNCMHNFDKISSLQNPQNLKRRIQIFLPISLNSDKIQKRTVPHLKAENLIITVHFMHFLQKIIMRAAMDQNVCIIFFVTVSSSVAKVADMSEEGGFMIFFAIWISKTFLWRL